MTATLETPVAGIQTPRIHLVPAYAYTEADYAVRLITKYGVVPDAWQTLTLEPWLARRASGLWACPANGLSVPRQNGKNYALEAREIYGMVALKERILHTAHEVRTSKNHFKRMLKYFGREEGGHPDLVAMVASISKTNGEEAIYLKNGGELRFVSRSKRAARGFSSDLLVIDEAQELDDESYEAILPIISASPNPQQIMTGTPPGPTANGEVFTRMRNDGVEGIDLLLSWLEWSADKKHDISAETTWGSTNPGYPHRISAETITGERSRMSEDSFRRERLGMWSTAEASTVIDMDHWRGLVNSLSPEDPVAFAIDVAPDRSSASIGIAGYVKWVDPDTYINPDGEETDAVHIEIAHTAKGTGWIVDKMVRYKNAYGPCVVIVDEKVGAGELIIDLKRAGVRVETVTGADISNSWGMFMDRVNNRTLVHADMPVLDTALMNATTRTVLSGYAWDRRNVHADITPLVAVTFAAYGLVKKRKPRTKVENPEGQERMMFFS